MSLPGDNTPNPYAPPQPTETMVNTARGDDMKLVKDFRSQVLALGVLWIIFGLLALALAVFFLVGQFPVNGSEQGISLQVMAGIVGVLSLGWFVAGVTSLMKQHWGIYLGTGLSYLSLVGNVIQFNLCGAVILIVILVQAHRVLGFAKEMNRLGIPLDTKL